MGTPAKRYPVIISYSRPFRLIFKDETDTWTHSLEEINRLKYDYVKLHRVSTNFRINASVHPFLYMGFDGAIILPALDEFNPIEKALEQFNRFLGELVLGGIYYEAIRPSDLVKGLLYETGYFRSVEVPHGPNSDFQIGLQTKTASSFHLINLYKPDFLTANQIVKAREKGRSITATVHNLSPALLLSGISAFVERSWAEALSNFWICIEQTVSFLWERNVTQSTATTVTIQGRKEFLQDNRTWTSSTKIELLFQKQIISAPIYALINVARKARNALAHEGTLPNRLETEAAFDALFKLLAGISCSSIDDLDGMASSYKDMDPITQKNKVTFKNAIPLEELMKKSDEMMWFGPFPPIPGEAEWSDNH